MWRTLVNTPRLLKVERSPVIVRGIMIEENVLRDSYTRRVGGREILGIWSFQGIDPGDRVEMDTNVYADGIPIVLRSPHKPKSVDYDAWQWYPAAEFELGGTEILDIDVLCNVTGKNWITPRGGKTGSPTARPHWGLWVIFKGEGKE